MAALTLFVLVSALVLASASLTPQEDNLLKWAVDNGARLKVTIGPNAAGFRGLIATEDIKVGEEILMIPYHICLKLQYRTAAEIAAVLLRELHSPDSRFKPYLAILPAPDKVLNLNNFPEEYIEYLGHKSLISRVETAHAHLEYIWSLPDDEFDAELTLPEAVGNISISLEEFKYAAALINSRTLSGRKGTLFMIPVMDLANHDRYAPHEMTSEYHRGVGMKLTAGSALRKGDEVCITYGALRNDELLLNFGFLEPHEPPVLAAIDTVEGLAGEVDRTDQPFTGTRKQMNDETSRLEDLYTDVREFNETLDSMPNTRPEVAAIIRSFHKKRLAAIELAIRYLYRSLEELKEL